MSFSLLAAAGAPNPLLPATAEIVVGFVAFGLLYLVMRRRVGSYRGNPGWNRAS